jgi:hypothetical protein
MFQQRQSERSEASREHRMLAAAREVKQREEQREDWRRDVDNRRDERRRQDEVLRSVLEQTITAYHAVKRIRRQLDAETHDGRLPISLEAYDRHLLALIRHQLVFEGLKRTAPVIDERLTDAARERREGHPLSATLQARFRRIEHYLNDVIDEYRSSRYLVAARGEMPLSSLPKLAGMLDPDNFRPGASTDIDEIISAVQHMLLAPLLLPSVDNQAESR